MASMNLGFHIAGESAEEPSDFCGISLKHGVRYVEILERKE
jgi:hypothetical protein